MLAYLDFVADRLDLRRDIRLDTRVQSARYDEDTNTWTVRTDCGATLVAKYLISGMGVLSQAIYPDIPGIDSFTGEKYHTAHWPREGVDLAGKRVGLIGLGASGIQIVPEIAPLVDEFVVFQRTPNFVVETTNDAVTADRLTWLRDNYDAIYEKAANHPFGVAMEPAQFSALEVSDRGPSRDLRKQVERRRIPLRQRVLQRPRHQPRGQRTGIGVHPLQDPRDREGPRHRGSAVPEDLLVQR